MSPRPSAWLAFGLGIPVLIVLGVVTLFFAGSAASGCDLVEVSLHASFCGSEVGRRAVALLPVVAVLVYLVAGVVGIIALRNSRRVALVPVVLGLLVIAAFVIDLVIVNA